METMFDDLHCTLKDSGDGFHMLSQGLREEVERLSRTGHQWESYNVDQLVCVCTHIHTTHTLFHYCSLYGHLQTNEESLIYLIEVSFFGKY